MEEWTMRFPVPAGIIGRSPSNWTLASNSDTSSILARTINGILTGLQQDPRFFFLRESFHKVFNNYGVSSLTSLFVNRTKSAGTYATLNKSDLTAEELESSSRYGIRSPRDYKNDGGMYIRYTTAGPNVKGRTANTRYAYTGKTVAFGDRFTFIGDPETEKHCTDGLLPPCDSEANAAFVQRKQKLQYTSTTRTRP